MARVATPNTIPTTSTAPIPPHHATYFEQSAKNALGQLIKISKSHRGPRAGVLTRNLDVQNILDNEMFMIQTDRRTKLTPLQQFRLVHTLAHFFLERVEDGYRYSYFEAIFIGRENDSILHEYRIETMMQLASFALQFPVLQVFNHIMTWLSKISNPKQALNYSDMLIEIIVDHFVRLSDNSTKTHEYLLPLEFSCSEFSALFVARAPLHCDINIPMCTILASYLYKNIHFILRHLRDTPYLGDDFATKTLPKMVSFIISGCSQSEILDHLTSSICYIISKWETKIVDKERGNTTTTHIDVLDLLITEKGDWSTRKCQLIAAVSESSARNKELVAERLDQITIPPLYRSIMHGMKDVEIVKK